MGEYKRLLCVILCAVLFLSYMLIPAGAEDSIPEETSHAHNLTETQDSTPTEETEENSTEAEPSQKDAPGTDSTEPETQATEPQETEPDVTEPAQTQPQETIPEEPEPEETEPPETKPAKPEIVVPYNPMPRFFQTDYPDTRYGSGTIATSGCSITCMAMVAGYLTGHVYFPDQLARWFGGKAQNNMARLEYAAEQLQLPFKKAYTIHDTFQALEEGKVCIALMNRKSLFTNTQHFIVLCGLTEDGKILVNDPYAPNYDNWQLKRGLTYGFEYGDILLGYSGAWIFDKNDIPEDPFIYYEPDLDKSNPRYPDIQLTDAELELLAKLVWVEAQGECFEGQQAVAEIVFNRLASPHFPSNLRDVIYGEGQFRSTKYLRKADPNQTQYDAIELAFYGPYILPEDVVFFGQKALNDHVWGRIGGHVFCYYE